MAGDHKREFGATVLSRHHAFPRQLRAHLYSLINTLVTKLIG